MTGGESRASLWINTAWLRAHGPGWRTRAEGQLYRKRERDRGDSDEGAPNPNRGKAPAGHRKGRGPCEEKERATMTTGGPWGCQPFNNRKCGNKKKCLQTQEDTAQGKTGAKPRQGKCRSFRTGDGRENDACGEAVRAQRTVSDAAGVGDDCQPRHSG